MARRRLSHASRCSLAGTYLCPSRPAHPFPKSPVNMIIFIMLFQCDGECNLRTIELSGRPSPGGALHPGHGGKSVAWHRHK